LKKNKISKWARYPIKTHIITKNDNLEEIIKKYASPYIKKEICFL